MSLETEYREFIAIGAMLVFGILFSAGAILTPLLVGPRRTHGPVKDSPYECGLPPLTDLFRFSVRFHVVAMLFILFDIEVVFLIGWAALFRRMIRPEEVGGIGWPMLTGMLVFLAILEIGHIYAWKKGVLDWAPIRDRTRAAEAPGPR